MSKISFPNISKKVNPIPKQPKLGIDLLVEKNEFIEDKMKNIEQYHTDNEIKKIENSRVNSRLDNKGERYSLIEIKNIYSKLFSKKVNANIKKNDLIDEILKQLKLEHKNKQTLSMTINICPNDKCDEYDDYEDYEDD